MSYERLLEALSGKGFRPNEGLLKDEKKLFKIAKNLGIDPMQYIQRFVTLENVKDGRTKEVTKCIVTSPYITGKNKDGFSKTMPGLKVSVSSAPQIIADLQKGLELYERSK